MRLPCLLLSAAIAATLVSAPAFPAPRLLETYPTARGDFAGAFDGRVITLLFSEPIDPLWMVAPQYTAVASGGYTISNPNHSYELLQEADGRESLYPTLPGPPVFREDHRLLEIPAGLPPDARLHLRLFRSGFRSRKGDMLDRDYDLVFAGSPAGLTGAEVRAALPASSQASDPSTSLSLYFSNAMDRTTLRAELRDGLGGPLISPLVYTWDIRNLNPLIDGAFLHLTVDHPPLPPSPRPYVFRIVELHPTASPRASCVPNPNFPNGGMRFTIGPALAGDLDGDSAVTVNDALIALKGLVGTAALTSAQTFAGDISPREGSGGRSIGDGRVDISDVARILRRAIGLIPDDQWP